jgi:EAL domain-containing protein (putative c-di-GMP-specific phosphodiesterase class I)
LQLEADLRKAIEEGNQFQVYYQPIVSLQQGTIAGFEALVRWNHPKQGLIAPDQFIPVAEETGLILSIDLWVLREACRPMRVWQLSLPGAARLKISVNFSSKQFSQLNLPQKIAKILKETDLEPESLKLELTESKLLDIAQSTRTTLLEVKSLGIELVLDDFGTGYSSFSYLHNVPIDALKIDRSFIWKIGVDENSNKIVQSIIRLSHKLGMYAIAEGVETVEQFAQLKKCGCEYGQGYLFAKPLNSAAAWELIASKPIWS